jgi:hypothetical protein
MKPMLILLLSCTLSWSADTKNDDSQEITSKVFEHDYNCGKTHSRTEAFYRGKARQHILLTNRTTEGGVTKTSRGYSVGDMLVTEADEDGDGIYETLIIENTKTNELEMFSRKADGSVRPVDAKTLALTKQQHVDIKKFWDKAFDKDANTQEFVESAKALRERLQKAEKEKTKEQK